nr:hypothetical protein GCM10017745_49370 [Saccharothrix mutabilis subsp. capreolus]
MSAVDITKSADVERAVEGDVVTYQVVVTNTGNAAVQDIDFTDDLSDVLDDATWADVATSTGTATFTTPFLSWTGDLAIGKSTTITYRVVVNVPDRETSPWTTS